MKNTLVFLMFTVVSSQLNQWKTNSSDVIKLSDSKDTCVYVCVCVCVCMGLCTHLCVCVCRCVHGVGSAWGLYMHLCVCELSNKL